MGLNLYKIEVKYIRRKMIELLYKLYLYLWSFLEKIINKGEYYEVSKLWK